MPGPTKKVLEDAENDDSSGTIRACSNVKLANNSTGVKAFTALKRVMDEGFGISHSDKRFLEYDNKAKSLKDAHRAHIFGKHVDDYMRNLPEENEEDNYDEDDEKEEKEKKRRSGGK